MSQAWKKIFASKDLKGKGRGIGNSFKDWCWLWTGPLPYFCTLSRRGALAKEDDFTPLCFGGLEALGLNSLVGAPISLGRNDPWNGLYPLGGGLGAECPVHRGSVDKPMPMAALPIILPLRAPNPLSLGPVGWVGWSLPVLSRVSGQGCRCGASAQASGQ